MMNRLHSHKYSNCYYTTDENGIRFVSYSTTVIVVDADGWLTCTGTYSQTTRRQIGWFMREMGFGTYQLAKMMYEDGRRYNIHTGEIESL